MRLIIVLFVFICPIYLGAQTSFYQDIFHGGVTGNGGSTGGGSGIVNFSLLIPNGSMIKKAYLITARDSLANDITITLNGNNYLLNDSYIVTCGFFSGQQVGGNSYFQSSINVIDITSDINPNTINYLLTIPPQNILKGLYSYFYLYVVYENPSLPLVCTNLFLNTQDVASITNWHLSSLNPLNNIFPVGLEIGTSYFCDTIQDGSYVAVNGNTIGLLGGSDSTSYLWTCASPYPNFGYYNNTLYGLDDDTPDAFVGGTDATADIKNYVNNNSTSLDLLFTYQTMNNSNGGILTNPVRSIILTYTTPCAIIPAVVSSDTAICQGQTVQLHASGGTKYEWKCLTDTLPYGNSVYGLSCKNCANPVFSGDSSAVYTVRVWNGDSCSVVRPVSVTVNPKPKGVFSTVKTTCGEQKGVIKMQSNPVLQTFYSITENGDTLQSNYQNIPQVGAGNYTAFFIDTNGCKSNDSLVTVGSFSNVVADFTVTPTSGGAPLGVHITNTSQNAQNYQWSINGQNVGNPPTHFDTSGTYTVQLVAWNQHPECADTMTKTVLVFDSLIVQIPNVFSPNNDGVNDIFTLEVNLTVHVKVVILNRWGNVVYQTDQSLSVGKNDIWNGVSNNSAAVTDGTYFYRITFQLDDKLVDCNLQPCEVKKEGFVEVVR